MAISDLCIKCSHLHPPTIGKRNKHNYTCDAFPEGKPEVIHQEYRCEPDYLSPHYIPIECNNGVYWEPSDPIASEMVKLIGVVIKDIDSQLSSVKREELKSKCYENPFKSQEEWINFQNDILQISYDFSAPEATYLENILSAATGNDTLFGQIRSYLSFAGYNSPILGHVAGLLWAACSKEEKLKIDEFILKPDFKTAKNIVIYNYRYALFTQHPGPSYWMIRRNGLRGVMIQYFLQSYLPKIVPFNYTTNTCISCRNCFSSGDLASLYLERCGPDLMYKLVPELHSINDFVLCPRCIGIPSPFDLEQKNEKQLLQELANLYSKLGFIPPQNFRSYSFIVQLNFSPEKMLEIIKIISKMYPYTYSNSTDQMPRSYKQFFIDWLDCLTKAGIIDESGIKTHFGYRCKAIDGHTCHSLAERKVDDFFLRNGIPHDREPFYPYDLDLNENAMMRADWIIENTVFVEFFGLTGNDKYDEKTEKKIEILKKKSIPYILLFPGEEYHLEEKFKDFIHSSI